MGGPFGTYRGAVHMGFWWAYVRERDHFEGAVLDEKVIIK
jgi:hypothetical protein